MEEVTESTESDVVFVFREPCDRCGEERICIGIVTAPEDEPPTISTILCEECIRKGFKKAKNHYKSTIEM